MNKVFAVITSAVCLCLSVPARADSDRVMKLDQVTSTHGPVKTFIKKDAVKVCFTDANAYLMAAAPSWKVVMVNNSNKTIFTCKYEQWLEHRIKRTYIAGEDDAANLPTVRQHQTKYANTACTVFVVRSAVNRKDRYADLFVIESQNTAPQIGNILAKWFDLPPTSAIPLGMLYCSPSGRYLTDENKSGKVTSTFLGSYVDPLTCRKISSESCPSGFFTYPQNYKPVTAEVEIFSSPKKVDEVKELMQIDDSESKDKKAPKLR